MARGLGRTRSGTVRRLNNNPFGSTAALDGLFRPTAVTIVGASDRGQASKWLIDNLTRDEMAFPGIINLVNSRLVEVGGRPCVPTIGDISGDLGLLYLLVPPQQCLTVLGDLTQLPTAVVVYAEGFEPSTPDRKQLSDWAASAAVPVLGPGSSGLISSPTHLIGVVGPHPQQPLDGPATLVVQSGGLFSSILRQLNARGVGVKYGVSYGQGAILDYEQLALDLLSQGNVDVVACYVEAVKSIEGLARIGQASQRVGKPVVMAIPGTSDAGRKAALSHTGAVATPRRVLDGIFEQYGMVLVSTGDELVWAVHALAETGFRRVQPPAVGVLAGSGAGAVLVADRLAALGIPAPEPSAQTVAQLMIGRDHVSMAGSLNPFDGGARSLDDRDRFARDLAAICSDKNFGIIVRVSGAGLPSKDMPVHVAQAATFIEAVEAAGKLAVLSSPIAETLIGVPKWPGVSIASGVGELGIKLLALTRWGIPMEIEGASPQTGVNAPEARPDQDLDSPLGAEGTWRGNETILSGTRGYEYLRELPLHWPKTTSTDSEGRLRADPSSWFPIVAKAEVGLAHRARSGGVLMGISSTVDLELAIKFLISRFGGDVSISAEVPHDVEYLVGFDRLAPQVGVIVFGRNDREAGILTGVRVTRFNRSQAGALVARYVESEPQRVLVEDLLLGLQELCLRLPEIISVDLNPVTFDREGRLVALDGKVFISTV